MTQSRLVNIADLVKTAVETGPFADPAITPKEVRRVWQFEYTERMAGLRIYVIPLGYEFVESASRGKNLYEYRIGFIVVDRFLPEGAASDEWVDERVKWIETYIWDKLSDPRTFDAVWGVRPESGGVVAYDADLLREKKIFFSDVTIAFRQES